VLVYFYGGPGSQEVINEWQGKNYFWFQLLANKGFIIACCDNRGTGGKGIDFQHSTTNQLGKLETQDQIAFGKYLQSLPFVDKNNLATFGWSFGGYLSSLCILLGADVYKSAIAVAPVTSWRFYDTIYTERYLKNPTDNAKGYDENSPLTHAAKLRGKYLLVHGTADDNVHYQNAIEMQKALIQSGKHFETYTYPDKAHGISGAKTRLHLYQKMTDFLEKNLK
jgi:dipeptidyl-peptidase 4